MACSDVSPYPIPQKKIRPNKTYFCSIRIEFKDLIKIIMDTKEYFKMLDGNTQDILLMVDGFSANHLSNKKEGGWTVMEILEHICITENRIHTLMLKPSDTTAESKEILGKEKIKHLTVTEGKEKVMAPEALHPKGELKDVDAFKKRFQEQRKELKEDIENGKLIIDNRTRKHPRLGEMTVSDWLYFLVSHTERHVEQIGELV
jgi:hypothetical protein